jgi:hypothetical protein
VKGRGRQVVWLVVLSVWLTAAPVPAGAHRLDEYLQATRLSLDVDRVGLEIDLTAGVAVAAEVYDWIDTNRDGQIARAEGEAYAGEMLRSVALSVDGRPVPITLIEIRVPPVRDMRLGIGAVQVRATANVPAAISAGPHRLSYFNTHRSDTSVYLVNALVPADPRIHIAGQQRDRAQHGLTLDYTVAAAPSAQTWSLVAALVIAGGLGVTRRPRTNARRDAMSSPRVVDVKPACCGDEN